MKIGIKPIALLLALLFLLGNTPLHAEAAGGYTLQVNKGTNVVTVFDSSGKAVKAFVCSVGIHDMTPSGTFKTMERYLWKELYYGQYGQYATRITGNILFHSVGYTAKDKSKQSISAYNKLGTAASHGCVRLTVVDAKWIYDNCALGTAVQIIRGTAKNDPLGKPTAQKVNTSKAVGWDPTDPDPANPYHASQQPQTKPEANPETKPETKPEPKPKPISPFEDVYETDWFSEATLYVHTRNIMTGTSSATFSPKDLTTRAALITILYRLEQEPVPSISLPFEDVLQSAWYAPAICWALENGILLQTDEALNIQDGHFLPNEPLTREQLATIFFRYASYRKGEAIPVQEVNLTFTDTDKISPPNMTAVLYAIQSGLLSGIDGNRLNPQGNANRAQLAVILQRFLK